MAVDQLRAGDATRAGGALGRPAPRRVPGRWPAAIPARALAWAPVVAATALAAALRLSQFNGIPPNPYYDAAVRSMALSWHNFLFGAFEPGGSVSIDKPPVDLWLQVASVKLLGFGSWQLRLPAVLAGIAAVPLLYAVLRALDGRVAALAGALALAVLPIAVLTDRSDTMDSVMVALDLVAVLLVVRASRSQRPGALIAAGAVLGLAFNVKLLEALIVMPALVVLFWLRSPVPRLARLGALTAAGGTFVAVALSWLVLVTVLPGSKPFAIGSTEWKSLAVLVRVQRRCADGTASPSRSQRSPGGRPPVPRRRAALPLAGRDRARGGARARGAGRAGGAVVGAGRARRPRLAGAATGPTGPARSRSPCGC